MQGLDAAARSLKPISWSSPHTHLELSWRPHEVWKFVATDSAESCRPLNTKPICIFWPCSVLLGDWVAVVTESEETSQLDLLQRCHPITVPRWNLLSSWEGPILSKMFVEAVFIPRWLSLFTCWHGSDWNTWMINDLDEWVSTFVNIVYVAVL